MMGDGRATCSYFVTLQKLDEIVKILEDEVTKSHEIKNWICITKPNQPKLPKTDWR